MYKILIKAMLLVALAKAGLTAADLSDCSSRACVFKIIKATQRVGAIDWKPISVFSEVSTTRQK